MEFSETVASTMSGKQKSSSTSVWESIEFSPSMLMMSSIIGFPLTEIDLKVASKFFGSRFACGSSVTGEDEIVIQGDVKDELFDVLTEKWPQVLRSLLSTLSPKRRE